MAHVRFLPSPPPRHPARGGHIRQSSEDLIQDLEHHLGSTMTEYLQVRLTYRHSGFPRRTASPPSPSSPDVTPIAKPIDGIVDMQTTLETTARAVIKRHNSASMWSPRPTPQPTPLFEIIALHWGPVSASEVMRRVVSSRTPSRRVVSNLPTVQGSTAATAAASERGSGSEDTMRPGPGTPPPAAPGPASALPRTAPPIPRRQTSLHKASMPQPSPYGSREGADRAALPIWPTAADDIAEDDDPGHDRARQIWTEIHRATTGISSSPVGGTRSSYHVSRVRKVPSSIAIAANGAQGGGMGGKASATSHRSPDSD
ncbi:hypothetical protein B0H67DRAFT_581519 [Lasiosphaeris hirsuta]|uniref:Uncharacterized protein n=1 Tax=Lasiosphaeris hirsuta TaxID=260670 RepID=A0AA40AH76_9PEZI|nr:hypothetical protein B0H67DRAFT_581519 [Lasiosphaeris hirsuta]